MRLLTEHMEFTWDMIRTLPQLNYYLSKGEEVEVHCKRNLISLYKLFTPHVVEKSHPQKQAKGTYSDHPPYFAKENWLPPPLKERFKDFLEFDNGKPVITVNNKYTPEWASPVPLIFLDTEFLDNLFTLLKPHYNIVYIRPSNKLKGYQLDGHQALLELGDFELIEKKHPEVITIQDMLINNPDTDFNTVQFALLASSDRHIAVAGGNACVSAYFGGELIIYNCPTCPSHNRRIWETGSWLEMLSNSSITGYKSYSDILTYVKAKWLN